MSGREERIARDERREHVRLALGSAAAHGYYVFENLMTEEAGMIDFLAVGPVGVCIVVVRDELGRVTSMADGTLYHDRKRFDDDPKGQADELTGEVRETLGLSEAQANNVICFTRANLYYLGGDQDVLRGICPIWDLPLAFSEAPVNHTPADVAEIADRVREVYGRPPIIVPQEE